jgi:hypothetical protein
MPYWILRYRGPEDPPTSDLERVARDPAIRMVDRRNARLALVDVAPADVSRLSAMLPRWSIVPEGEAELPSTWPRGDA